MCDVRGINPINLKLAESKWGVCGNHKCLISQFHDTNCKSSAYGLTWALFACNCAITSAFINTQRRHHLSRDSAGVNDSLSAKTCFCSSWIELPRRCYPDTHTHTHLLDKKGARIDQSVGSSVQRSANQGDALWGACGGWQLSRYARERLVQLK